MTTGILLGLLGIYAVLFNSTSLFSVINWLMDPNFWQDEAPTTGTLKFKIFTWVFLGMLHIIWGINIYYTEKYGLEKREKLAWKCLLWSVLALVAVDVHFTVLIFP